MEKISWTDHVRNEEVLLRVSEQRNILHEIRKRKANWIGHVLRRNCLLKQVIEGKIQGQIEVTRRRGRRSKKLLDDLGDRRGYSHLKEEALDPLSGRIVLEEAVDLSYDRLLMTMMTLFSAASDTRLETVTAVLVRTPVGQNYVRTPRKVLWEVTLCRLVNSGR
jgi:hypothetical protein